MREQCRSYKRGESSALSGGRVYNDQQLAFFGVLLASKIIYGRIGRPVRVSYTDHGSWSGESLHYLHVDLVMINNSMRGVGLYTFHSV